MIFGEGKTSPLSKWIKMQDLYFKKPNGIIIKATIDHDLDSLKSRFVECDKNGNDIVLEKKPKKKIIKKKDKE